MLRPQFPAHAGRMVRSTAHQAGAAPPSIGGAQRPDTRRAWPRHLQGGSDEPAQAGKAPGDGDGRECSKHIPVEDNHLLHDHKSQRTHGHRELPVEGNQAGQQDREGPYRPARAQTRCPGRRVALWLWRRLKSIASSPSTISVVCL